MVEGVRLESVCTARYRGFESLFLRDSARRCAIILRPTPSGSEGSSGKRKDDVIQFAWLFLSEKSYSRLYCFSCFYRFSGTVDFSFCAIIDLYFYFK